jgi:hypothetical protein
LCSSPSAARTTEKQEEQRTDNCTSHYLFVTLHVFLDHFETFCFTSGSEGQRVCPKTFNTCCLHLRGNLSNEILFSHGLCGLVGLCRSVKCENKLKLENYWHRDSAFPPM